jgi:rubrerythrin
MKIDASKGYLHNEEEAVKIALEKEIMIRKFYLDSSVKITNDMAKKAFIFLADEELKHEEAIMKFNESVLKGKKTDMKPRDEEEALRRLKEFFGNSLDRMNQKIQGTKDELELYDLAKERELASYNFYKESAEEATHPNVKHLFTFLKGEEDRHYHLLTNIISYLRSPEHYFMDDEQWNFEGA